MHQKSLFGDQKSKTISGEGALSVRLSVCLPGTGVHCDQTMRISADLSLWVDSFGGYNPGGLGPPVESRGEAFGGHCLQILTAETIQFENFAQFTS